MEWMMILSGFSEKTTWTSRQAAHLEAALACEDEARKSTVGRSVGAFPSAGPLKMESRESEEICASSADCREREGTVGQRRGREE